VVVGSALADWNHVVDCCSHSVGARNVGVDSNLANPTSPIITFSNLAEVILALVIGELSAGVVPSSVGVFTSEQLAFWMDRRAGLVAWDHDGFVAISANVFFEVRPFFFGGVIGLHDRHYLALSVALVTAIATVAMANEKGLTDLARLWLFLFCHVSTI